MEKTNDYKNLAKKELIIRPRLDAIFDHAFLKPFIVVNAGAGFGKTTSVTDYLKKRGYRIVWFTFAAPDNIAARFWEHLTRVFASHRPSLGAKMQTLGFPENLQMLSIFLADLTNELYEDNLTVAFVFDDLHLMKNPFVQTFLSNLLSSHLENSFFIFISRTWPILHQQLPVIPSVIRSVDLRFSLEETSQYLIAEGIDMDSGTVKKVYDYVAGWPIALSLVVLSIKRSSQKYYDDTALGETKFALHTLFEQEIFSQYTAREQDLLIKLSILDSFPQGLVHAITGDQQRSMDQLLNHNIFIRYDDKTGRLHFDPLYHEFLRDKLTMVERSKQQEAYEKAAIWCREKGHYYDAVRYYQQCGQYEELWSTLQMIEATRHSESEADFFIEQIEQLPEDFVKKHPMAYIVKSAMLINNHRFLEAAKILDEVEECIDSNMTGIERDNLLGECYIARGLLILSLDECGFEVYFKKAAKLLPEGSRRWNNKLQFSDYGPWLEMQSAMPGELEKILTCYKEGIPYIQQVLHGAGRGLDILYVCESLFLTEKIKDAQEFAYRAIYEARSSEQYDIVGKALLMLLRIYTALRDDVRIKEVFEQVRHYEKQTNAQNFGIWDIVRGWYYADLGDLKKVARWILNPVFQGLTHSSIDSAFLIRMRCMIASGQYSEVLAILSQFADASKGKGSIISLLYVEIGRAITYNHLKNWREATTSLTAAYRLANENQLIMPFIEYGSSMRSLLEHVDQETAPDIPPDWIEKIRIKSSTYAKRHAYLFSKYRQEQDGQVIDYRLSLREKELLENLSQGLTRVEMADTMKLSINTIKSLTKQTFAKLGAINAADAVRIAIMNRLI